MALPKDQNQNGSQFTIIIKSIPYLCMLQPALAQLTAGNITRFARQSRLEKTLNKESLTSC